MHIFINGKKLIATKGETVLSVAKRNRVDIPTLCHHDALEPVGACRLCTVEITHEDWNGWKGLVTSCLYPVVDGLVVATDSPAVVRLRQTILDLLVARCPESAVIRDLAEKHGPVTEYKRHTDGSKCIMCYLCTRACAAVGCHAISAVNRGTLKEIAPPFHQDAIACVGCGTCAAICPTGHIQMTDKPRTREIWGRTFDFIQCEDCGAPVITAAYRDFAVQHQKLDESYYTTCTACKKKRTAQRFSTVGA
ncbi:MAG: 2Fe-2S iron-sulfur cluster-binding protein [Myxococcota bacterium]|nr:2Fe-2S iron-sulfur cluster-binding protein [Myxococcota bacterium]